jgi:hypothetical protein
MVELCIVCNCIDQKEIRACEIARLVGCDWTLEIAEDRQANQRIKRLPVPCNASLDNAEAQRARCRGGEGFARIERCQGDLGVFQGQAVGGSKGRQICAMHSRYFNLLFTGERSG